MTPDVGFRAAGHRLSHGWVSSATPTQFALLIPRRVSATGAIALADRDGQRVCQSRPRTPPDSRCPSFACRRSHAALALQEGVA